MVARSAFAQVARKTAFPVPDERPVSSHDRHEHWLTTTLEGRRQRFALRRPGPVRIGRSESNCIVLANAAVSREHAHLEWCASDGGPGAWRVTDRGSSTGTRVNGEPVRAWRSAILSPGDRVEFGPLSFEYSSRTAEDPATVVTRIDPGADERIDHLHPAALEAVHLDAVVAAGEAIHAAVDERSVAEAAVRCIARASGFADCAFVRAGDGPGAFEVLAAHGRAGERLRLSRSVLARARFGPVVVSDAAGEGDRHRTLAQLRIERVVCVAVEVGQRCHGFVYLADGGAFRTPLEPVAALVRAVASVAALALANLERLRITERLEAEQRAMFDGTMQALIASIDAKDPYTRGHSARVAEFAAMIAARAGLTQAEAERVRLCGLVHDIGKIGVSEEVLRKPGKLTEEEFRHIAAHPVTGHDILRGIPQVADILPGVLHHHERWDGRGYPHGIAGEGIPLLGRIIAVADALDAMTTSRTYRSARPMAEAVAEIARCAGTHFDPVLAGIVATMDRSLLQSVVGLHVFGPSGAAPAAQPASRPTPAPAAMPIVSAAAVPQAQPTARRTA